MPSAIFGVTADTLVNEAHSRVGHPFSPLPAQCAFFVRDVFRSVGIELPVVAHPSDGFSTSEGLADSFAGHECGPRISRGDVQPGDIVMFFNTFGNWPPGTITHVGIAVSPDKMVDCGTQNGAVTRRSIGTFEFAEARRPPYGSPVHIEVNGQTVKARNFLQPHGGEVRTMVQLAPVAKAADWKILSVSTTAARLRNAQDQETLVPLSNIGGSGFVPVRRLPADIHWDEVARTIDIKPHLNFPPMHTS